MAGNKFFLTAADRAILNTTIKRVGAGKASQRPIPRRRRHPMSDGGSAEASIKGAFAIIFANVPPARFLTTVPHLPSEGKQVIDFGLLEKDVSASGVIFAGALLVNPDGTAIFEDDPNSTTDPPAQIPAVRDVLNPSFTAFEAPDGIAVAGADVTQEQDDGQGGTTTINAFALPAFDFRSLPGYTKGTAPSGTDDPDLQIPYHSGGDSDFKLSSGPCN